MDVDFLESLLGVSHRVRRGELEVPYDGWRRLKEEEERRGMPLIIVAAREGSRECLEFLLRSGVDVNTVVETCDSSDSGNQSQNKKRAIDFALEGNHGDLVLLLFQWDSLPPESVEVRQKLSVTRETNADLNDFLDKRQNFHLMVSEGNVEEVERILSTEWNPCDRKRYWANVEGESALHTLLKSAKSDARNEVTESNANYPAGKEKKLEMWALLMSHLFFCKADEGLDPHDIWSHEQCDRAMDKYFIPVKEAHVYNSVGISKVTRGVEGGTERVREFYDSANKVEEALLIFLALQGENDLDIVLETREDSVCCLYSGMSPSVRGLANTRFERVYLAAKETRDFSRTDVISKMVHELAHHVMYIIFNNGSLPYDKEDQKTKEWYEGIVERLQREIRRNPEEYHGILQTVVSSYSPSQFGAEFIVRIPEMISKFHLEGSRQSGVELLNVQAPYLYQFYLKHVIPKMKEWINSREKINRFGYIPKGDLRAHPELLCAHGRDDIQVRETIDKFKTNTHDRIQVFRVSNIHLGVSHLKSSGEKILCVDWEKYRKCAPFIDHWLNRGYYDRVAVICDINMEFRLCDNPLRCDDICTVKKMGPLPRGTVLVIPKETIEPSSVQTTDYSWSDVADRTKRRLLNTKVFLKGNLTTLDDLLTSAVGSDKVSENIARLLDAQRISALIDGQSIVFGKLIFQDLEDRRKKLLREDPGCSIERTARVYPYTLDEENFRRRKDDAFLVFNARREDLEGKGFGRVSVWEGGSEEGAGECRLFVVEGGAEEERGMDDVTRSLRGGKRWQLAHFYAFENGKFVHRRSEEITAGRCHVISGYPGDGRTVHMYTEASRRKVEHPCAWVDVIDLTDWSIRDWSEVRSPSGEDAEARLLRSILLGGEGGTSEEIVFHLLFNLDGMLHVYFDGFDNLKTPAIKEKAISFFVGLRQTAVGFTLSTRDHERIRLEEKLSTYSRYLLPLETPEQTRLLDSHWNTRVSELTGEEKMTKLNAIISVLPSVIRADGLEDIIERLKSIGNGTSNYADFRRIAGQILSDGEFIFRGEREFCQNVLNVWILGMLSLEHNFALKSLQETEVYKSFVDEKIKIYVAEKKGIPEESKFVHSAVANETRTQLKKYSAFVFLNDQDLPFDDDLKDEMLISGFLTLRGSSLEFIHPTFGVYLLREWSLENPDRQVDTSQIFLAPEMEYVRRFMERNLA